MDKIRIVIKPAKRRNPVTVHARRHKGGPHRNRRKDGPSRKEWTKEIDE
jgi:hypothetical protein